MPLAGLGSAGAEPGVLEVFDVDGGDDDVLNGAVHSAGCYAFDGIDDLLGVFVCYFTEDGVAAVEPGGVNGGDEELGAVGAGACVGHGQQVGLVEGQFGVDFVLELVAGAADALAEGVAALDHEVADDAVEDDVLVEGAFLDFAGAGVAPFLGAVGEADEVLDGEGCVVAEEVYDDVTVVGVDGCFCCCCHAPYSCMVLGVPARCWLGFCGE